MRHSIYVDASGTGAIRWYNKTTGEIGGHRGKSRPIHELEIHAVLKTLEDLLPTMNRRDNAKLYCDNDSIVKQLNHEAGINTESTRKIAERIWTTVFEIRQRKNVRVQFLWVPRRDNPAGKMLGT